MTGLLYAITVLSPLAVLASGWYRHSKWSLIAAAVPALIAGLLLPSGEIRTFDWLLLGSRLGTDGVTEWLLPAAAAVWAAAAAQHAMSDDVDSRTVRFRLAFLIAMSGNLLLMLAQDAITFYVGYALMGLAGYGLVMHRHSTNARVAASSYMRWTIAGELILFSGLLSLVHDLGSTQLPLAASAPLSAWTLGLLIVGFGIKIGLPGLHAWMPGTYSACSTAGSAAFSGAMANAGVLGLLHFLPLQRAGYETAGVWLLAIGLTAAFYGVLLGLPQRRPKVILAYSSISQLGTLAALIGLALINPELAPALIVAVTVYAVHHGLTKSALFLALDSVWLAQWRGLSIAVLIALSLMLAGLPFSSGAVAKGLAKEAIGDQLAWLTTLLAIAGTATTLLMTRFLVASLSRQRDAVVGQLAAGSGIALLLLITLHIALYWAAPLPALSVQAIWPLLIAMILVIAYAMLPPRAQRALQPVIPKGDLPKLLARALLRLAGRRSLSATLARLRDQMSEVFSIAPRTSVQTPSDVDADTTRREP